MKLCTRDYLGETCPVLYLFYSILRPSRTAGPIFTLYSSNDVFPHKDGPFES